MGGARPPYVTREKGEQEEEGDESEPSFYRNLLDSTRREQAKELARKFDEEIMRGIPSRGKPIWERVDEYSTTDSTSYTYSDGSGTSGNVSVGVDPARG